MKEENQQGHSTRNYLNPLRAQASVPPEPERTAAIYDGRDRIGALIQRGKSWDVFDPFGAHLGTFPNVKAAAAAIVGHSRPVPCVRDHSGRGGGGNG